MGPASSVTDQSSCRWRYLSVGVAEEGEVGRLLSLDLFLVLVELGLFQRDVRWHPEKAELPALFWRDRQVLLVAAVASLKVHYVENGHASEQNWASISI